MNVADGVGSIIGTDLTKKRKKEERKKIIQEKKRNRK